jgi:hypothetical protein
LIDTGEERSAWHWNGCHVPSGTGVLPARAQSWIAQPDGITVLARVVVHRTSLPRSRIREWNVPVEAKGPIRIQSTERVLPSAAASRTMARMVPPIKEEAGVPTGVPSTKNATPLSVQSIRNTCGVPIAFATVTSADFGVSRPLFVSTTNRVPSGVVLKRAQGGLSNSKPMR